MPERGRSGVRIQKSEKELIQRVSLLNADS